MNIHKVFWTITITLLIGLLLPILVQDGMFVDGVTYSAISKNWANGLGSFWQPHYTQTLYPTFYEHPPLVFGIQGIFFKIFGDSIYIERFYTFLMAILTAIGILKCWQLFIPKSTLQQQAWLPILLWISIPFVFWSYRSNILENTMGVFTLYAIYAISKSLVSAKKGWLILGSWLIIAAFLSKGFVALFPLAAPFLYFTIFKSFKKSIIHSFLLVVTTAICVFILAFLFPEIQENITAYIRQQLLPALNGEREITANNRFKIIGELALELIAPIVILLFFIIKTKFKKQPLYFPYKKTALYFFLIGLSASIPLIISLKQRKFYLLPSIPFFALSISALIAPYVEMEIQRFSENLKRWLLRLSSFALGLIFMFSFSKIGNYARNKTMLEDIYTLQQSIPEGTIIGTTPDLCQDWALVAYMSRIGYLSLGCENTQSYFLAKKSTTFENSNTFNKIDINLNNYDLYQKK